MLNERKLTERELESREVVLQGLLQNKQNLVKKYGKDAEKVMYGIATKKAKTKVEGMNKDKIKELIQKSLTKEDATPKNKDFWADYQDIGQFYLEGFGKEHTLTNDQLENLGKKIVKQLYKGDVGKAYDDIVGRVRNKSNDPKSAVVDRAGNTDSLAPGEISEADAIPTSPGKMEKGDDGKMYNVIMSNAKRKMALRSVIDILKAELEVSNDDAFDYIRTHRDDLFDGTVDAFDNNEVVNDYKEYISVNTDFVDEDNDPSGEYLEGDPNEFVVGELKVKMNHADKLMKERALPLIRKKLAKAPKKDKVASKQKMKLPSGLVNYMDFTERIAEKLTKKNDAGDFVDDFKKSDAKQFKGKSDNKKKEMAVAAYLSKQND